MKKILALSAALLLTVLSFAQNGKSIYKTYSDASGVSAVYISPAMFRLIGKLPEMEVNDNDIDLSAIVKTLDGFYLIDSENPKINNNLKKDVESFVKAGKYELLMEVKDDGEIVHMYTVGTDTVIRSFVMIVYDGDECTFLCLDGEMSREQFEAVVASAMQD